MKWLNLFFNPRGCIENRQFGIGSLILILIVLVMSLLWYYFVTQDVETRNFILINTLFNVRLCLIYPFFCVLVKRLHASGKSGVWAVLIILLFLVLSFVAQSSITAYYMLDEGYVDEVQKIVKYYKDENIERDVLMEQLWHHRRQMLDRTYLPVICVYLLFLSIGCAAVSRMKIKLQNNKYNANYLKAFD
ncbi:MAG: hypothetical protein COA43_07925 [Robiginitomaculum sp.]|nr:MAG: hypothetical protein COA43_07925 [Robiginitomaculum sp.]